MDDNTSPNCTLPELTISASSSVSQKSQDQLSNPSIQPAIHSNSWNQQQQSLANPNLKPQLQYF